MKHLLYKHACTPRGVGVAMVLMSLLAGRDAAAEAVPAVASNECSRPAGACEDKADLTLATALRLAMNHNNELAAASREISARDGALLQAGAYRNPVLSADAEDIRRADRNTTLRLSQVIELGDKRDARIRVSRLARDGAAQDFAIRRREIALGVAQAFIELLAAQGQRLVAVDGVALAQRVVDVAARRVQAGKVSPIDETRARVALAAARIDADQALRDENAARRRVSRFWGNPSPRFLSALGDLEATVPLPDARALASRMKFNPIMQRTATELAQRKAAVELERSRRAQDVSITAGIRKHAQGGENGLLVGISIPLPLFDRNHGGIIEAQHRVAQAEDLQQAAETRLASELSDTYDALSVADAEVKLLRTDVLPAVRSVYAAANKGFEYGKFGFLEVLDAQRSLFQQQRLYLRALANYHRLLTDIDHLSSAPDADRPVSVGSGTDTTK